MVLIRPVSGSYRWVEHETKAARRFRQYEKRRYGQYTFRHDGWMIRVAAAKVQDSASQG